MEVWEWAWHWYALGNANAALAPIVFGKWMNISGSALANYWRDKPTGEKTVVA